MKLFLSRFTVGATALEICLDIGEKVKYQTKNNGIIDVIIDSEIMKHKSGVLGYEAMEGEKRFFIDGKKIVWWDGKDAAAIEMTREEAIAELRKDI